MKESMESLTKMICPACKGHDLKRIGCQMCAQRGYVEVPNGNHVIAAAPVVQRVRRKMLVETVVRVAAIVDVDGAPGDSGLIASIATVNDIVRTLPGINWQPIASPMVSEVKFAGVVSESPAPDLQVVSPEKKP